MKTAIELWQYVSQKGLKPLPKTSVSEWADNYRILSTGSAEPGRWKTSRAPYQKEIMDAFTQPGIHRVVAKLASQSGKALDITTPIPTPDGWKTMGELQPGDTVFDENGKPCHVTWCTEIMYDHPCFEITFSDRSQIIADAEHKWWVQVDKKAGPVNYVKTTAELLPDYKIGNRNTYAIPVARGLDLPKEDLEIDPYTLGVWLGDGNSMSAQITMADSDLFMAHRIRQNGHEVIIRDNDRRHPHIKNIMIDPYHPDDPICKRGHDKRVTGYTKHGHCAECARQISLRQKWKGQKDIAVDPIVHIQPTFSSKLRKMKLLGNKHIPSQYLRASLEQRWQLLQGIMDTDGCANKNRTSCEITLKSKRLIDDISELLHSLGIKHSVKQHKAICTNSPTKATSIVWRIMFTAYQGMPVFSLPRKKERLLSREGRRTTESERRRITNIQPVNSRPVKCIAVDSPNHLYLAGKSMIPTHNSDCMNNVIGRFAHLDPCPILLIQPTVEMATDFSKTRVAPMIRDTKVLNQIFFDAKENGVAKTRDGNNTILSKLFPGGRLILCGANSPAGLASRPVRVLLADEVDRFPDSAGSEGDPVDLAAKRMSTYWNYVMGLFSTPTNEGSSRIDIEYLAGTQEEWQYECPNCQEYHVLSHIDMFVPEDDLQEIRDEAGHRTILVKSVKWRCPDCGYAFTERQMRNAKQKYVAQNPIAVENGIRSFYVNAFTSPWLTWPVIMKEWLEAKGDPEREKVVMNTRFGLSYRQTGAFEDETIFLRRREQYNAELPDGVLMLTAAVDTQDNRFEYEICGWGVDEECWGISKGVVLGTPDKESTHQALDDILDRVYHFANGTGLKILRTFIDTGGHYSSAIYKYCERRINKQRFPIKGMGGPGIPLNYKIGRAHGSPIPLVMLGVDDGKQMVMSRLSIDEKGPRFFHFPLDGDSQMEYRGYDQLYFKGIIAEQKKIVKKGGQIREIWEQIDKTVRNEPLDLRVYNLAAMQSCRPDWTRLYNQLNGKKNMTATTKTAKTVKKVRRKQSKARTANTSIGV